MLAKELKIILTIQNILRLNKLPLNVLKTVKIYISISPDLLPF